MAAITIPAPARAARPATRRTAAPAARVQRASAPAPAPVRLTRRGRRLVRTGVVVLALLVVLAVSLLGRTPAGAGSDAAVPATVQVIVQPGDSLWSIAKAAAPGDDVRATIERIATLNNLDSKSVVPGQTLVVPAPAR
jgi:nucleoid-associated protein YgaU